MSAINVNIKDFEAANPKRSEIFNTAKIKDKFK